MKVLKLSQAKRLNLVTVLLTPLSKALYTNCIRYNSIVKNGVEKCLQEYSGFSREIRVFDLFQFPDWRSGQIPGFGEVKRSASRELLKTVGLDEFQKLDVDLMRYLKYESFDDSSPFDLFASSNQTSTPTVPNQVFTFWKDEIFDDVLNQLQFQLDTELDNNASSDLKELMEGIKYCRQGSFVGRRIKLAIEYMMNNS